MRAKKNTEPGFAIYIANDGFDDLQLWKVYRVLPDPKAAKVECLRVIDESGEDYLYPVGRFIVLRLPKRTTQRLLKTAAN